jgi:hypothetical protein
VANAFEKRNPFQHRATALVLKELPAEIQKPRPGIVIQQESFSALDSNPSA